MPPRKYRSTQRRVLEQARLGLVLDRVPGRNVRNFVRHHACEFSLVISGQQQTLVDVKETTRQCKRIDFVRVDDFDRERHLRVGVQNDVLTHAIYVLGDHRVVDKLRLAIDFRRQPHVPAALPSRCRPLSCR